MWQELWIPDISILLFCFYSMWQARMRGRPTGSAALLGCKPPCLWRWPASWPGSREPKLASPPGSGETPETLVSLQPSSWRRVRAILGGGRVARAGSGGKVKAPSRAMELGREGETSFAPWLPSPFIRVATPHCCSSSSSCFLFHLAREKPAVSAGAWRL
jgi:hypothetical protein